ncbi:MAG: FHA domain-containing protein, partial [Planctomycetota bacterium]
MKLVSYEHGEERSFPLREGSTIIGRHPSCHVVIPGRKVSKRHLQCHVENGVVTIRDLDSSNGTLVNGEPVSTRVLEDGDQVTLGGYELVFDAEAGPAGGEAAAAAGFDFEPVGQPGQPPPGSEEAESTPPPGEPPSREVQAEPLYDESAMSEDDTPADGEFVPQAYSPDSLQPQVVARDGRMFLRNPRTNQEVEIVPRREGGPADLSGYYAEKEAADKRKNMLLIGAAIGVGLLLIVALALTSGTPDPGPGRGTQKKFGRSGYNKRVDRSIDLMKEGDFAKALALLEEAEDVYPNSQIAGVLHQVGK